MTIGPTIKEDDGRVNARILAKIDKVDYLARVEAARRKITVTFRSPEIKRIFLRYFDSMQLNMHFISVIARTRLPASAVEEVEASVEQRLKQATQAVDAAIDQTAVLLQANGITSQADYDTLPLELTVRVISGFGRLFLDLMCKVDQFMPLLDTLAIDGVINQKDHIIQKSTFTRSIRSIAGGARNFAYGLRGRMNALAEEEGAKAADKSATSAKGSEGAAGEDDYDEGTNSASANGDAVSTDGHKKSERLPVPNSMPAQA